jgi:hypothetical protein
VVYHIPTTYVRIPSSALTRVLILSIVEIRLGYLGAGEGSEGAGRMVRVVASDAVCTRRVCNAVGCTQRIPTSSVARFVHSLPPSLPHSTSVWRDCLCQVMDGLWEPRRTSSTRTLDQQRDYLVLFPPPPQLCSTRHSLIATVSHELRVPRKTPITPHSSPQLHGNTRSRLCSCSCR